MSRKKTAIKRNIAQDSIYDSKTITKFINQLMLNGKKSIAEKIIYSALDIVKNQKKCKNPFEIFQKVLENVRPSVEVKSRRVGGSTYQVPVELRTSRSLALAIRWVINAARKRKEHSMIDRLANEILEASEGRGFAMKKRDDVHKMAEANKAFAHYRW